MLPAISADVTKLFYEIVERLVKKTHKINSSLLLDKSWMLTWSESGAVNTDSSGKRLASNHGAGGGVAFKTGRN